MSDPIAFFVDHKVAQLKELGALLTDVESSDRNSLPSNISLVTCQRFELYYSTQNAEVPGVYFRKLHNKLRFCHGYYPVLRRVSRIACGLESLLLGEKFVQNQVKLALNGVNQSDSLRNIFEKALYISQTARETHNFYAATDYTEIAFELLQQMQNYQSSSKALIVIGSGAIGRGVLSHSMAREYRRVVGLSRWPKKLKRRVQLDYIDTIHPDKIPSMEVFAPYDCIVAISDTNEEYLNLIRNLCGSDQCTGIIDFSSNPLFSVFRPEKYIHEYDVRFCRFLKYLNRKHDLPIDDVSSTVDNMVSALSRIDR